MMNFKELEKTEKKKSEFAVIKNMVLVAVPEHVFQEAFPDAEDMGDFYETEDNLKFKKMSIPVEASMEEWSQSDMKGFAEKLKEAEGSLGLEYYIDTRKD